MKLYASEASSKFKVAHYHFLRILVCHRSSLYWLMVRPPPIQTHFSSNQPARQDLTPAICQVRQVRARVLRCPSPKGVIGFVGRVTSTLISQSSRKPRYMDGKTRRWESACSFSPSSITRILVSQIMQFRTQRSGRSVIWSNHLRVSWGPASRESMLPRG